MSCKICADTCFGPDPRIFRRRAVLEYGDLSRFTFPVPEKKRRDKVMESYLGSVPREHHDEFMDIFNESNGKRQTKLSTLFALGKVYLFP